MRKLIPILALVILSCNTKKETIKEERSAMDVQRDSLTAELINFHKLGQINGFGVALVNQEGFLYVNGIGYSDVDAEKPYSPTTIQNIGSVSKTFIGVALMKALEEGKLTLDDPINDYLPFEINNPTHPADAITIRHLATHTSTIIDTDDYDAKAYVLRKNLDDSVVIDAEIAELFNPPEAKIPLGEFLENLLSPGGAWYNEEIFTEHAPGEIFEYSNIGSALAGYIIEQATGMSFNEYTQKHILKPLNMNSSGWAFKDVDLNQHSILYASIDTELPLYSLITYPDGGMITSPTDLAKYLTELIKGYFGEGTLLSPESYQELYREQLTAENYLERDDEDDFDDEYNSGIFMGFTPSVYIGHTGGDPGIATYMFFNPETKTGRIMMINTSVRNQEGVDQFYSIWNRLGEYEEKLTLGH